MKTFILTPGLIAIAVLCGYTASAGVTDHAKVAVQFETDAYYVSPTGDNSNPGSLGEPWATPGFGSRQLSPGDTLIILGGRYSLSVFDDCIITPPSGRRFAWTTIKGEAGSPPILAGSENLNRAVDLSGRSYIWIENLEITNDSGALFRDGIAATGDPSSHIVLKNLDIHHLDEFGIDIGDVSDLKIIDCTITHCGFGAVGGPAGEHGGWRNVRIIGCSLSYSGHYYQGGPGPGPYDRPDGFGIASSSGPIEIENTIAEYNRGDGLDSKAENTYIHECFVANNSCDGIKLRGGGSRIENVLVYGGSDGNPGVTPWAAVVIGTDDTGAIFDLINVTVDDATGNNHLMYVQYDQPNVPINLTVVNTIFRARGPGSQIYLADAVNFVMGHNLFYFPGSSMILQHGSIRDYLSTDVGDLGPGNLYGNPLFVDPGFGSDGDYHLQAGCPAIDAGTSILSPSLDLEGQPRPQSDGYDIGCYER